ncbi:hypothetical protein [Aeromicrobium wangtongii]|uniref:Uncharacterized protein n=1 Tax=Aeromicrobium wangtongii TaxID=2969247 RepID=A0ABY5MHE2_9ACTN|nr:hypothetical protein [Aeromicrobium wangtongii]MCD9197830.1 hypothetical protein [Aeromicrobium wangtongii]UUP15311.1 hypothetical protein NQV15_08365 [Aeromicrobium wangtongii]
MGLFATFVFAGGSWDGSADQTPRFAAKVHDSDFVTIDYAPALAGGTGHCYVGFEPRHYFEDETASDPVDTDAEARGLAAWAADVRGTVIDPDVVRGLLASPEGDEAPDVFVEAALVRLLLALGLPLPEDLEDWAEV